MTEQPDNALDAPVDPEPEAPEVLAPECIRRLHGTHAVLADAYAAVIDADPADLPNLRNWISRAREAALLAWAELDMLRSGE